MKTYTTQSIKLYLTFGILMLAVLPLLASYWSVISDSAVDITTRMFERDNTGKTYSHKHRESVMKILNEPNSYKSNPVYWAPFMVVGVN